MLRCPECDKRFRPDDPVPPGGKVRCPCCDELFRRPRQDPDWDDDEDEYDDERPRRPARRRKKSHKLLWGILAGAGLIVVLLCGGVIWGIASLLRPTSFPEQA